MNYRVEHAKGFSDSEIEKFKKIVIEAGEVEENSFNGLILKNPILMFVPNTSSIDAVGALKIPNDDYKNGVFMKSESKLNSANFSFELGWIVSVNEGRGFAKMITEILSEREAKIYATVREKNGAMQHILQKYGFSQSGVPYQSSRGNYRNILFVKDK